MKTPFASTYVIHPEKLQISLSLFSIKKMNLALKNNKSKYIQITAQKSLKIKMVFMTSHKLNLIMRI